MSKQLFLMKGHEAKDGDTKFWARFKQESKAGLWYLSEKLDGMRAFWDGGAGRGKKVAWDSITGTGLWSSYGKVVRAPDWWLDGLPRGRTLDGELWAGRGKFQEVMSICKTRKEDKIIDLKFPVGGAGWDKVRLAVFDSPPLCKVWGREIENMTGKFTLPGVGYESGDYDFGCTSTKLLDYCNAEKPQRWRPMKQELCMSREMLEEAMDIILGSGGEGVMLRYRYQQWVGERVQGLRKVKGYSDGEGVVQRWTLGEGRLAGMVGSIGVRMVSGEGVVGKTVFVGTGLSDDDRRLVGGQSVLEGKVVRIRWRELTKDGDIKEGRFMGARDVAEVDA